MWPGRAPAAAWRLWVVSHSCHLHALLRAGVKLVREHSPPRRNMHRALADANERFARSLEQQQQQQPPN